MRAVFSDSGKVEKEAKARFCFPEFIMMENAAAAMEDVLLQAPVKTSEVSVSPSGAPMTPASRPRSVLIVCGS